MLGRIRQAFPSPPRRPTALWRLIGELSEEVRAYGVFNLLLSDSQHLYAFCGTKLNWITRKAPFGVAQLKDDDVTVDFQQETTPDDIVSVIATEPLTQNEQWHALNPGKMIIFKKGEVVFES
jgi:glutamine amidotransferase